MQHRIPDQLFDAHTAVLAKTGGGKTYLMRGVVERLLERRKRVCIIDPKGDWYGLRLSADGKTIANPDVMVFGGQRGHLPINRHAGASIAELVATGNRPTIIDLSDLNNSERTQFFMAFAEGVFRHNRAPLHLVIDEVHNFAPQGKVLDPDSGKMLHWANRLASEGRGKGVNLLFASQRPQKVHKDFLTCAETLIAMRVVHPRDRAAIAEWMDGVGDKERAKTVLDSLAEMPRGQAWVWSPEIRFFEQIAAPPITTFDSMAGPSAQINTDKLKGWESVNLDDVKSKLSTVVAEAEANDPKKLKARIAELERAAKVKTAPAQAAADPKAIERAVIRAVAERDKHWEGELRKFQARDRDFTSRFTKINQLSHLNGQAAMPEVVKPKDVARPSIVGREPGAVAVQRPALRNSAPRSSVGEAGDIPKGQAAILAALIQYPDGLRREQLTVLTGYKRSSRDAYIARLAGRGFCDQRGDTITATSEGHAALPNAEPLPTGEALQEFWMQRLPEGERAILRVLIDVHPNAMERGALDDHTPYKRSSRDAYLARLKAKQLIDDSDRGMVKASDNLFEVSTP